MLKLLMVEDDRELCEAARPQFAAQGYLVDFAHTGEDGLFLALREEYDLMVLDRMLPVLDGLQIVRAVREKGIQTPIILVTALGELGDRVEGLDSGADDYLPKPFAMEELFARIRALTRRPPTFRPAEKLSFSDLELWTESLLLRCGEKECELSRRESALLACMMKKPDRAHTREQLLAQVWGADAEVEPGNVDSYISFLRRRLRNLKSRASIRTVYGVGYRLEEQP